MYGDSKWFVIVNPASGNGAGRRNWPSIRELLESNKFDFEFALTDYPRHSIELVVRVSDYSYR